MSSPSSSLKPLVLYGDGGINPSKVRLVLHSLSLPFTVERVLLADIKKPAYVTLNPNGRLPALRDPNNGDLTLFESVAIIEYLVERYDSPRNRISFPAGSHDAHLARCWAYFQASGQGPYFGQAAWFKLYSPEKIPLALDRYYGEVDRVNGVLEEYLKKQEKGGDGPWLVGGRCSYADLIFVSWEKLISMVSTPEEHSLDKFPVVKDWYERMEKREDVQHMLANMKKLE